MFPEARNDLLLIQEVGNELVVYDEERHLAHRLSRTAALVWRHCDGKHSVEDLTARLRKELGPSADEDLVRLALDRLEKAHLLVDQLVWPAEEAPPTRRRVLARLKQTAAALLVPAILTIVAPAPSLAQSVSIPCVTMDECMRRCDTTVLNQPCCSPANTTCQRIEGSSDCGCRPIITGNV
jgi:hypothetical protein